MSGHDDYLLSAIFKYDLDAFIHPTQETPMPADPNDPRTNDQFRNINEHGIVLTITAVGIDFVLALTESGSEAKVPKGILRLHYEPIPEPLPLPPLVDGTLVLRERVYPSERYLTSNPYRNETETGRSIAIAEHPGSGWYEARGAGRWVGYAYENEPADV